MSNNKNTPPADLQTFTDKITGFSKNNIIDFTPGNPANAANFYPLLEIYGSAVGFFDHHVASDAIERLLSMYHFAFLDADSPKVFDRKQEAEQFSFIKSLIVMLSEIAAPVASLENDYSRTIEPGS